jgi:tetratricopeptide (TPR) repeat protein
VSKGRISLVLIVLSYLVFAQVSVHEFVDWDDGVWITENPKLSAGLTPGSIWRVLAEPHEGNWIPLSHLSLLLTRTLSGPEPAGFLLGNLLAHVLASLLLFLALERMTGALGRSAFVAAVFAVHPLHVESVAWASERKDVLAGFFFAMTLLAYARYAERPDSRLRYAWVLLALACGLLSKPTVVTLPLVLLLLDFWPLGRLRLPPAATARRVWLEKLPMLGLALAASLVTLLVQRTGGGMEFADRELPLGLRLWNAAGSYGVYLAQTVWPADLRVFYSHPLEAISRPRALLSGALLVAISAGAAALVRRAPYLLVGWLWYLVTLVPMIGIVQVGGQAHADRYMYLPLQGLSIAVAWGAVDLVGALPRRRRALGVAAGVLIALLAVAAHRQVATWRDSLTLFGRAVALDPDNLLVQRRFAVALRAAGRLEEAQQHYQEILRRKPRFALGWLELGDVVEQRGDLPGARSHYQQGLSLDPGHAAGQASLGRVLLHLGRPLEARMALQRARELGSESGALYAMLGTTAQLLGRDTDAVAEYREALERDPDLISAANNLAWVLASSRDPSLRDPEEAIRLAELALEKRQIPDAGFLDTLAVSYAAGGRFDDAVSAATRAAELAEQTGQASMAREIRGRIPLFRAHQAWVEPGKEKR